MQTLWIHTFPPRPAASGVFMYQLANQMEKEGCGVKFFSARSHVRSKQLFFPDRQIRSTCEHFELVHSQYGSGCGFFASHLPGVKVLTLRGSDWYGGARASGAGKLRSHVCKALTRRSLHSYNHVITVSNRMRKEIQDLFPKVHCSTLPSGVDLSRFQPMRRSIARSRLGFAGDERPWVLFASALKVNPIKRPELALATVSQLRKSMPAVKLITLSNCPHEKMSLWLCASDALLVTSLYEGWPNIIKEALACNLPFVSTDVSDLRQLELNGKCFVVDPTATALASALGIILNAERPETLREIVAKMDLPIVSASLLRIYHDLYRGLQPNNRPFDYHQASGH